MLESYSPLLIKYNELWAKYGHKLQTDSTIQIPISSIKVEEVMPLILNKSITIISQEDSIKCSLLLREAFKGLAKDQKKKYSQILSLFCDGVSEASDKDDKLKLGLSKLGNSEEIIQRWKLFFQFQSLDDLFLLDEDETNGVISIE